MSEESVPTAPTASMPPALEVDFTVERNRVTTLLRLVLVIPIAIVYGVLTAGATTTTYDEAGKTVNHVKWWHRGRAVPGHTSDDLFRQRYPRWWFDFARELTRFATRIGAYFVLLTDEYPSTVDEQRVHLDIDYPTVERDLNRWLPLVKWFLAIPHYIVLFFLSVGRLLRGASLPGSRSWFTGHYPRGLFDFVVGVGRWGTARQRVRVSARHRQVPPVLAQLSLSSVRPLHRDGALAVSGCKTHLAMSRTTRQIRRFVGLRPEPDSLPSWRRSSTGLRARSPPWRA